ncbi:hypothetical protein [Peterkaempfera bronchialis]|uniref:hypothetical protein n=1 Tax=Peterkaempfera bronchialis TaxID=2126346 RepID=UPI003C303D22
MRVKLRPDAHYAPVPQGVHWARAGRSFVLAGPPGLYPLLDSRLGLLAAGTSLDDLVRDLGDEAARPVLRHILDRLLREGVLLDLDALTAPPPDPATAARHAEVLAFLEARSDDPYRVFARLRGATVAVVGGGPAARLVERTLRSYGVEDIRRSERPTPRAADCDLAVLVDDADAPGEPPRPEEYAGVPLIPVHAGRDFALVGPVGALPAHPAPLLRRVRAWIDATPDGPAPRPLSAVLAGSLAASAALALLTGIGDPAPGPTLVHGGQLRTRQLPAAPGTPAPTWERCAAPLALLDQHAAPAEPTEQAELSAAATLEALAALTQPWSGLVARGDDATLIQMPVSLATARPLGSRPPQPTAGWGHNRAEAVLDALLAAVRVLAAQDCPPQWRPPGAAGGPPVAAAAGSTAPRWLLDGALRCLDAELTNRPALRRLDWQGLTDAGQRSLWSVTEDYFRRSIHAEVRALPGLGWALAAVEDTTGTLRARAWGPDPDTALYAALGAGAAAAQADPALRERLGDGGPGTALIETLPDAAVRAGLQEVEKVLAEQGRRLHAARRTADPVLGELPVVSGLVWCA